MTLSQPARATLGVPHGSDNSVLQLQKQPAVNSDTDLSSAWSDALQSTLDQPPAKLSKRLFFGGIVFSCAVGCWAWFGSVQHVSHAQGQLVPLGEAYKVQPTVEGEVAQIIVEEGDTVEVGQLIAALDTRLQYAEVERLEQGIVSYQAQLLQIEALIERTQFEAEVRQAIAAADVNAQRAAVVETQTDAETTRQMLAHLDTEIDAHLTRLERLQPLVDAGAIASDQLFQVEQSIRESEQSITQNEGNLEKALTEGDRLKSHLARQQAEGQRSQVEQQQRLHELQGEATGIRASIQESEALLKAARTKLDQMFVYAPCDGLVLSLDVDNVGEMVKPGQTIAAIAPNDAPLVLSAALPSGEAGLITGGMAVNVKFDAFPYQDYGVVSGTVMSISPDTKMDDQLGAVYTVDVALEQDHIIHEDRPVSLQAGQTAKAEIVVRRQRILELLLDPIRQLQAGGLNL
ncbi:MAG: HlyD family efflux transporter periplasmic adaptor subunit [Elainellaceae cyanobacterium]